MSKYPYRSLGTALDRKYRNDLNANFQDVESDIKEQKQRVDNLITGVEQPSEVVDARGEFPILRDRLDNVNSLLAQTMNFLTDVGVNVKKFGATGDGVTDDTNAIRDAIAYLKSKGGGSLYLPDDGQFLCDQLTLTTRTTIFGKGRIISKTTGSALKIIPNPNTKDSTFWRLRDFEIKPQVDGSGAYGIEIVLNTGAYFSNFEIDGVKIRNFGGYGLFLNNDANNMNGFFTGTIRRCWIENGIKSTNLGDSITISENTISGRNTGVFASCNPGASQLVIRENNITTTGGTIALFNAYGATIDNNQLEHPSYLGNYTGAYNAFIYLKSTNYCKITRNNINPAAGSIEAGDYAIKIDGGHRCKIDENIISKGKLHHVGFSGSEHTYGGGNSSSSTPVIEDLGTSTFNVTKTLTLQNNWLDYDPYSFPRVKKSEDGSIILGGTVKGGITDNGTIIATLPTGFIPVNTKRFNVMYHDGTTYSAGLVQITPAGELKVVKVGNNMLVLDGITFTIR